MKIFNLDSPLMQGLTKMADLMLLNLLAGICCIPIITAGASLTALNYMALKMARNEECYIFKGFFKSFKENFKQATIIWLILLAAVFVLAGDFIIMNNMGSSFSKVLRILIMVVAVLVTFTATFLFPVLAKFDNTVLRTIKNAFMISILQLPKTILMIIMNVLPWILMLLSIRIVPLSFLFGLSAPAFVAALLYNKFFKKLENQIAEANPETAPSKEEEDERIFRDELDETISIDENRR